MGVSQFGCFLDVGNEVFPGGREALVGLRLGTAFNQGFDNPSGGDFFAPAVEDLLLELSDQSISFIAQLDGELRHASKDVYLMSNTLVSI